ncbi:MAG TPA: D-aminoacyl-tRNA deacylase [Thermoplasmata archaeon]|nr:D-aminoacyl-tRNA deacylase [Thermoplasmata archaeon]
MSEAPRYVVVLSAEDPVASAVADRWGLGAATGLTIDGAAVRDLAPGIVTLRRPGFHVRDERLANLVPEEWVAERVPFVFPSIHSSAAGQRGLTVHPLGNVGALTDVGGRPRSLVPSAPRLMVAALRRLAEAAGPETGPASYEATHHGPFLPVPAFFAEIGFADDPAPPPTAVGALAEVLTGLEEEPRDRVVLGVGGGHYAPHFSELALERHVAFGHIIGRHALPEVTPEIARQAWDGTPAVEGIVYARAADVAPPWSELGPRLRDAELGPRR